MKNFFYGTDYLRSKNLARVLAIGLGVLLTAYTGSVRAGDWVFEKVADSGDLAGYGIDFDVQDIDGLDIAGGNVAFSTNNSVFKFIDGQLIEVANGDTVLPGAGGMLTYAGNKQGFSFDGQNVLFGAGQWGNPSLAAKGYYTDAGGSLQAVVDSTTIISGSSQSFAAFYQPVFSGNNMAFFGVTDLWPSGIDGVYKYVDGQVLPVATVEMLPQLPAGEVWRLGELSFDGDNVAFRARVYDTQVDSLTGRQAIFTDLPGQLTLIADTDTNVPSLPVSYDNLGDPLISGSQVAFKGFVNEPGYEGANITRYDGQGLSIVVDTETQIPGGTELFDGLILETVADGNVFFTNADSGEHAYYRVNDQGISQITAGGQSLADGSGVIEWIDHDHGRLPQFHSSAEMTILYSRYLQALPEGFMERSLFYSVDDGVVLPIIMPGDLLDGQTVDYVRLLIGTDLANDQIAFSVEFENGNHGIYMATIPEPGVCLVLGMGVLCLIGCRK